METDIFELVKSASLREIKKVFDIKFRKLKDSEGAYLSFYAALRGKSEIFKYLLSENVPVKGSDNNKNTILFYAVKGNNPDIVKLIIQKNIKVNQLNKMGAPAVCYIDKNTKPEIIEYLIKEGLKINTKYKIREIHDKRVYYKERNLLFYAIKSHNLKIISLLISHKVNFSTSLAEEYSKSKKKMFFYILYYGNLKLVQQFISANINTKLAKNDIQIIADNYISENKYILFKFITEELKYNVKDFKFGKSGRYNALTYAVRYKSFKIVRLLLKQGCKTDIIDEYYYKPVCYAVKYKSLEILKLLEEGNLNYVIYPSETLPEIAAENKDKEIIKYLLYHNEINFDFEFNYEINIDFGKEITLVANVKNLLSELITNDFTISYIKRALKNGVKIYNVHILLLIYKEYWTILKFLIKKGQAINLLQENEIKTETILSFLIKKANLKVLLEVLPEAIKNNYLIYYALKFEYEDIFKSLNLNSIGVIPEFNIKNKLLIPDAEPQKEIKSNFILDFGNRLFNVYYDSEAGNFIFTDNNGIVYKNLPKPSKKDNYQKAVKMISFFNKYKNFLID